MLQAMQHICFMACLYAPCSTQYMINAIHFIFVDCPAIKLSGRCGGDLIEYAIDWRSLQVYHFSLGFGFQELDTIFGLLNRNATIWLV